MQNVSYHFISDHIKSNQIISYHMHLLKKKTLSGTIPKYHVKLENSPSKTSLFLVHPLKYSSSVIIRKHAKLPSSRGPHHMLFYLTYILQIKCGTLSDTYSGMISGILSDIYSDILPGILSDIYLDILSGILSDTYSDIMSGILSGTYSDILSFYLANILTVYLAFYLAHILTLDLAFYLTHILAFYLAHILTFYDSIWKIF